MYIHPYQHFLASIINLSLSLSLSGYIVASGLRRSHGVQGLRILIQSDKPAPFVEKRAEIFLRQFQVSDTNNQVSNGQTKVTSLLTLSGHSKINVC